MIGHTYGRDFKYIVSNNIIQNFPTTDSEVTNSHTMLCPNLSNIRGNTVIQKPDRVVIYYFSVPR